MFPNFSSRIDCARIVLVSNTNNGVNNGYTHWTIAGYAGADWTVVKNDVCSYFDRAIYENAWMMVKCVRGAQEVIAGLVIGIQNPGGSMTEFTVVHPRDTALPEKTIYENVVVFQAPVKNGSTLRIRLSEETGINGPQMPPHIELDYYRLY